MADIKWSQFPSATPGNSDEVVGLHSGDNARFTIANIVAAVRNGLANIFVPLTRTINGKALNTDVSLDSSDIDYDNTQSGLTATDVQEAIDELAQGGGGGTTVVANPSGAATNTLTKLQVENTIYSVSGGSGASETMLAYVESGATASKTGGYTAGEYICWQGTLYTANTNIAYGTTLSAATNGNLTECVGGGFNNLAFPTERTTSFTSNNYTVDCYRYGYVGEIRVYRNAAAGADITLDTQLPTWARPLHDALTQRSYGDNSGFLQIAKNGNVRVRQNSGTGWFSATICYLTDPTT